MKYFIKKSIFFFIFCLTVFNVSALSVGGSTSGGKIYCDTSNSGFLSLTGFNGTALYWQSSTDSIVWMNTTNTIPQQSYYHLKQTTWYRAIVQDGVFPPDTSTVSLLTIYPSSVGGTVSGGGVFCGGSGAGTLNLTGNTGNVLNWQYSTNNGGSWTSAANTTTVLNYTNITQNTLYEAVVQSNPACPTDTSSKASFVFSPSIAGTVSGGGTFCLGSGAGTLNLTGNTGTILNWQYSTNGGTSWTTVINSTTQLNYTNITQNTLYEAVVQLGSCKADTSSRASFIFNPTVAGTLSGSNTVCYGVNNGSLHLNNNVGGVSGWIFSTNNGVIWTSVLNTTTNFFYTNLTQTTWYEAIVKNGSCKSDTCNHVSITVLPLPIVNAGKDTVIYQGESAKLNGSGVGTPIWAPVTGLDSTNIFKPVASPNNSIIYILTVTDANSCKNADSVRITVNVKQFSGIVSNLFTPNGDGINDNWYIQDIQSYTDNEVFVYNIYGNLVYTKKGYTNDWQGTYNGAALPDGTYYYVLRFDSSDKIFKGSLDIFKNQ